MFKVIYKISRYFARNNTDIDNWSFKLYTKISAALCMIAALICVSTEYFGKPIDCLDIEHGYVTQFCWLHGTYQFASEQRSLVQHFESRLGYKCVTGDEYYDKESDRPNTAYYQWVIFMLLGHGCLFMLPGRIWTFIEGGLIENFGPFNKSDEDDGKETKRKAEKFVNLSQHQNRMYLAGFFTCEMLNLGVAILNVYVMNIFLNGKFFMYGYDAVQYLMKAPVGFVNPMCSAFPTIVNCEWFKGGISNGSMDVKSIICILSQNTVNEKIYLLLWFWHILLFLSSSLILLYRLGTILVSELRAYELYFRARKGRSKTIESLNKHISLPEWFILCQIGRNHSDSRQFNNFLRKVEYEIKENQNNNTRNKKKISV